MNYDPETIHQIANAFDALFKTAVIEQKQTSGSDPTIAQIETEMRQTLQQVGEQALGILLSSLQSTPELEIRRFHHLFVFHRSFPFTIRWE